MERRDKPFFFQVQVAAETAERELRDKMCDIEKRDALIERRGPVVVKKILGQCGLAPICIDTAEVLGQLRFPKDETILFLVLDLQPRLPGTEDYREYYQKWHDASSLEPPEFLENYPQLLQALYSHLNQEASVN